MLKHVIDICWTSVRLSVTRWHCIKTAEYIVILSSQHDSPFILVLCISRTSRNSDGVTPCRGAKYRWGIKIERFSTNKSLYLTNDTRYRHGCYGRRIGTHTGSIKWCQFQWPWMNPNPVFKVRPFSDAEYLKNDCRYGHSYYGKRIGNHTQAFEWHQFPWPWDTSKRRLPSWRTFNCLNLLQSNYVQLQWIQKYVMSRVVRSSGE